MRLFEKGVEPGASESEEAKLCADLAGLLKKDVKVGRIYADINIIFR
jgi:hypothetical protein